MKLDAFPTDIQPYLLPTPSGKLVYRCLECDGHHPIDTLLYTCPRCGQVLLIDDLEKDRLKQTPPELWQRIFEYRKMVTVPALKGIYRYHEFIGSILPLEDIVYLGEGHTPMIEANAALQERIGRRFFIKNDGQNPSASFKDRGMASAFSQIHYLIQNGLISDVLAVCASTGDTSAAAALYAAYLLPKVKSAVLLPHQKVTPQQLAQPLGNGASVFEIPGVFDDCMKVVERLSEQYHVALLNSKNAWRILGQESYSYEIAQDFEYDLQDVAVFLPVGNAGNITAVMQGFLKFFDAGIISALPKIVGVQSRHANPVFRYYQQKTPRLNKFRPVAVQPSVAQAAMIGNPVSMPRVAHLVDRYNRLAGERRTFFVEVSEQAIMDWHLVANRHGHISCTHGGESLAGVVAADKMAYLDSKDIAVVDSTAHAIKFAGFQQQYFENRLPPEYEVNSRPELVNTPRLVRPSGLDRLPQSSRPLSGDDFERFVQRTAEEIAEELQLIPK